MKKLFLIVVLLHGPLLLSASQATRRNSQNGAPQLAGVVEESSQLRNLKDPFKLVLALECVCDCDHEKLQGIPEEIERLANIVNRSRYLLAASCKKFLESLASKEQQIIKSRAKDYGILVKGMNALGAPCQGAEDIALHSTGDELP